MLLEKEIEKIKNKIKFILLNRKVPRVVKYIPNGNYQATHISAFSYGNAGDTLLPVVLRDLFNMFVGVTKWHDKHVHKLVDKIDIKQYNQDDFIVIGGGGLFLADTHPNDISGWQWNCSLESLHQIEKPIIAFAIGYNRFRGQEDFKPIFTKHLNEFVAKAKFVGIRNHGSIKCLKKYLHNIELQEKLFYQPCMTTLISMIYPHLMDYTKKEDFIVFNCAFDRQNLRSTDDEYLFSIARVALEMSKVTKIKYFSHMPSDDLALPYFDKIGVKYELVKFVEVNRIIENYAKARLVIGMRGHAQMIPFGCKTPILSLISHDKMQWFLDDIGHSEWGIDIHDVDFEIKLLEKARLLYYNYKECVALVEEAQHKLWKITMDNFVQINDILNKNIKN